MRNTYNNIKPQRTARRQANALPRASNFEAFNTRCGKAASSKEITKYYGMMPAGSQQLMDKYILNWVEPSWNIVAPITTWDELKIALAALTAGDHIDAVLMNDIVVPAGTTRINIPNVDDAIVRIRSDTGNRYTIDCNALGIEYVRWEPSTILNNELILDNFNIINMDNYAANDFGAFYRLGGGIHINDMTFENNRAYSQIIYVQDFCPTAVTNCLFKDILGAASAGIAIDVHNSDHLYYNCAFQNIEAGLSSPCLHIANDDTALGLSATVLGCLFDSCIAGTSVGAFNIECSDTLCLIANCVFTHNEATNNAGALNIGGISALGYTTQCEILDCEFTGNTCGNTGGGITIYGTNALLSVKGDTCVTNNTAVTSGGGIAALSNTGLLNLTVESSVTFANNIASSAYYLSDADKSDYISHIFATKFSEHFQYGWNNYDIGYQRGTKLEQVTVPVDQCTQDFTTNNIGQIIPFPMIDPSCVPPLQMFKGWFKDAAHTIPVSDYTIFFSGDVLYPLFVPEPDCLCCDCLNDELKNAFEMLTTSVGGSHDAAGYIMQVIADKLTDPANTCELSDFQNILDELTKLTGYNQKEICCILSAMTGMDVG